MNEPRVDLVRIAGGEGQVEAIAENLRSQMPTEAEGFWPQPRVAAGAQNLAAVYAKLEVSIED